jgi:hypothetical protein
MHHPNREGHRAKIIALISVESALHGDDRPATQASEQQPTRVTFHRGEREPGNFLIRDFTLDFDLAREAAQASAKDDPDLRHGTAPAAYEASRRLDLIE